MTKKHILLLILVPFSLVSALRAQQTNPLAGTWQVHAPTGVTVLLTIADNYLIQTTYESSRFLATTGGSFQQDGNRLSLLVEFATADSNLVGRTESLTTAVRSDQLTLSSPARTLIFDRVDETPTALTGLWRITARTGPAGQRTPMPRGPRKTIKLLTGGRFQWVALNPETKQFFGTGGGTYTLSDGKYTESIDFFSRDNSRAGRSLTFGAAVNGDEWHHTGQSSTGSAVDKIWSREK
jgi:hypothetical protein